MSKLRGYMGGYVRFARLRAPRWKNILCACGMWICADDLVLHTRSPRHVAHALEHGRAIRVSA